MKDLRIAIVSANINDFDEHQFNLPNGCKCDMHWYTEKNLPFPLVNLNSRLQGKYIKINTHRFLKNYDAYIWIDGSVEIKDKRFISQIIKKLEGEDVAISIHPERRNVYEEIEYILARIEEGKEYLVSRYANEPLAEELVFYKNNHLPVEYPLYVCRFFARWNNKRVNRIFDDWWNGCLEYSNFDQTMFSYISWKHGLKIGELDYNEIINNFVSVHKHKQKN